MSTSIVQDSRRKRDVKFWKHITPLTLPFNHPVFSPNNPQLNRLKRSGHECKRNKKDTKENCICFVPRNRQRDKMQTTNMYKMFYKTSQFQPVTSLLDNNYEISHVHYDGICLEKSEIECNGLVRKNINSEANVKISNELFRKKDLDIKTDKLEFNINLINDTNSIACDSAKVPSMKQCVVLVKKLNLEKKIPNIPVVEKFSILMKAENDSVPPPLIANLHLYKDPLLYSDKKLNMFPRIILQKVEEAVNFLEYFELRPKWMNADILQPSVKLKKLSELRKRHW